MTLLSQTSSLNLNNLPESLGNPTHMIYCLEQIQFQSRLIGILGVTHTLWRANPIEEDFLLSPHIISCIEQCSNLINDHPPISFVHGDGLSDVMNGDLELLKISIQSLVEFALKYCAKDGQIVVITSVDGVVDEKTYIVNFKIITSINIQYDTSKIQELFNTGDQEEAT